MWRFEPRCALSWGGVDDTAFFLFESLSACYRPCHASIHGFRFIGYTGCNLECSSPNLGPDHDGARCANALRVNSCSRQRPQLFRPHHRTCGRQPDILAQFSGYDEAGSTISPVGKQLPFDPVKIAPGRTVNITANLLPFYDLRQHGTFIVRAVVDGGGVHALSPPIKFTIISGREVWKQTVGLPVATVRPTKIIAPMRFSHAARNMLRPCTRAYRTIRMSWSTA